MLHVLKYFCYLSIIQDMSGYWSYVPYNRYVPIPSYSYPLPTFQTAFTPSLSNQSTQIDPTLYNQNFNFAENGWFLNQRRNWNREEHPDYVRKPDNIINIRNHGLFGRRHSHKNILWKVPLPQENEGSATRRSNYKKNKNSFFSYGSSRKFQRSAHDRSFSRSRSISRSHSIPRSVSKSSGEPIRGPKSKRSICRRYQAPVPTSNIRGHCSSDIQDLREVLQPVKNTRKPVGSLNTIDNCPESTSPDDLGYQPECVFD